MDQQIQAVFENGVLRPLAPLDLPEHQLVCLSISSLAESDSTKSPDRMTDDEKQSLLVLLDQMERMPERSPADNFSQRDHDRVIYGLTQERLKGVVTADN